MFLSYWFSFGVVCFDFRFYFEFFLGGEERERENIESKSWVSRDLGVVGERQRI